MTALVFPTVHSKVAWNNWLAQFVGKQKLEAFVTALFAPMDDIEQALSDLEFKRGVFTAQGVQLNGVGEIVGQRRYVPGAFLLPFYGYEGQPAVTGYNQARYRRQGESNEDSTNVVGDNIYQQLINWKIIVNSASGTGEDIIRAMRAIFPDAVKVIVTMPDPRHVNVAITTATIPSPIFADDVQRFVPKMAGHRVTASVTQA